MQLYAVVCSCMQLCAVVCSCMQLYAVFSMTHSWYPLLERLAAHKTAKQHAIAPYVFGVGYLTSLFTCVVSVGHCRGSVATLLAVITLN